MAGPSFSWVLNAIDNFSNTYGKANTAVNNLTINLSAANRKGLAPTKAQIDRWNEFGQAVNNAASAMKNLPDQSKTTTAASGDKLLSGLGKGAAQFLGVGIGAYALRQAAEWTLATAQIGAGAVDVENSLERLSSAFGVNGQEITRQLVAMSHGSMTEMDAMAQVNRALFAQNASLARNLPQVFAVARAAAIKSGEDVQRVYDSLILGILRGSYRLIDNADIYLRVAEITERWAAGMGKTVDELSIQERQIAVMNAILQDSVQIVGSATSTNASYAESFGAVSIAFTDLRRELGKGLAEGAVDSGLANFVTERIRDLVEQNKAGNEFAKALADAQRNAPQPDIAGAYHNVNGELLSHTQYVKWLAQAYVDLAHASGAVYGVTTTRRGGSAFPASIKETAEATQYAARGSEQYKKNLDALSGAIQWSEGVLRSSEAALKAQNQALAALYAPAIRAAQGYRELGEAILAASHNVSAADFGDLFSKGQGGVESALLGAVGAAPTSQLSQMYDEYVAQLPTLIKGWEEQGLSIFQANLLIEEGVNKFRDWATEAKSAGAEAKSAGAEAEKAFKSVQKTIEDLHAEIESVVLSGLEVSPQDILDTAAGTYKDKALEPVRKLRDIVQLGFASPWVGAFDIPPEVLASGEAGLKAWAQRMSDRGAALLDINLIDKDAFLRQWDETQADAQSRLNTLNQLAQLLVSTGRVNTAGEAKVSAAKLLGVDDPTIAAKSISDGVGNAIKQADITGTVVTNMIEEGKKREADYKKAGGLVGAFWATGLFEAVKDNLKDMRSAMVEILIPEIMARLPKEAAP